MSVCNKNNHIKTLLSKSKVNLKYFYFLLIFLISRPDIGFAQNLVNLSDQQLETLLTQNAIEDAKLYLTKKKDSSAYFSAEKNAYYLNRLSQIKLTIGVFGEALFEAKLAEKQLMNVPSSELWGETYRAVCFAYIRNGRLDSALNYAEKLYEFAKKNDNLPMRRSALVALGNISLQNRAYPKSVAFYKEALQITEFLNDSLGLKVDYYNLGLALARVEEFNQSISYLIKASEKATQENAWDLAARTYGTLADIHLQLKEYENQEFYLKKSNEIALKIGNQQMLAMGYANLTESALRKGDYKGGIYWGNQSLDQLENRPLIQLQAKVDSMLFVAHKNLGNYRLALDKLESYDKKRLTIRNQAQKEKLDELIIQFDVEKKDLQIANQEAALREEKAKNQAFLIGIILLGSLAFFFAYINIKNSRTRKLLFRKEKELDQVVKLKTPTQTIYPGFDVKNSAKDSDEKDYSKLFNEIVEHIQVNKLYLDPKLNQQNLVSDFGTNRQYLYEAISKNGDNFRSLINRFRINEAKEQIEQLLQARKTVDFSILAEKVGFNSYPTFYRAFKSFTGLTPAEFNKELIQDLRTRPKLNNN